MTCGGLQSAHTSALPAAVADLTAGSRDKINVHLMIRGERPSSVPTGHHRAALKLASSVTYVARGLYADRRRTLEAGVKAVQDRDPGAKVSGKRLMDYCVWLIEAFEGVVPSDIRVLISGVCLHSGGRHRGGGSGFSFHAGHDPARAVVVLGLVPPARPPGHTIRRRGRLGHRDLGGRGRLGRGTDALALERRGRHAGGIAQVGLEKAVSVSVGHV